MSSRADAAVKRLREQETKQDRANAYNRHLRNRYELAERQFVVLGEALTAFHHDKMKIGQVVEALRATSVLVTERRWTEKLQRHLEETAYCFEYENSPDNEKRPPLLTIAPELAADELRICELIIGIANESKPVKQSQIVKGHCIDWQAPESLRETAQGLWNLLETGLRPWQQDLERRRHVAAGTKGSLNDPEGSATKKKASKSKSPEKKLTENQELDILAEWIVESTSNNNKTAAERVTREQFAKSKGISIQQFKRIQDKHRKTPRT